MAELFRTLVITSLRALYIFSLFVHLSLIYGSATTASKVVTNPALQISAIKCNPDSTVIKVLRGFERLFRLRVPGKRFLRLLDNSPVCIRVELIISL